MNNKRAYFKLKMKFAQSPGNEYLLEYSICSFSAKLHKYWSTFQSWDQVW